MLSQYSELLHPNLVPSMAGPSQANVAKLQLKSSNVRDEETQDSFLKRVFAVIDTRCLKPLLVYRYSPE